MLFSINIFISIAYVAFAYLTAVCASSATGAPARNERGETGDLADGELKKSSKGRPWNASSWKSFRRRIYR